jgi:hypothetical protein
VQEGRLITVGLESFYFLGIKQMARSHWGWIMMFFKGTPSEKKNSLDNFQALPYFKKIYTPSFS